MRFTKLTKWKMRLADYLSWFRDESWHAQKLKEAMNHNPWLSSTVFPGFGAGHRTLVETHELDEPFLGEIYEAAFHDGSKGYLVQIFEPARSESERGLDEQRYDERLVGRGYPSMEVFNSVEEARAALTEALRQANNQKCATVTFTDRHCRTFTGLPMLEVDKKKEG